MQAPRDGLPGALRMRETKGGGPGGKHTEQSLLQDTLQKASHLQVNVSSSDQNVQPTELGPP